jgi:hypothetical protein
MSWRLKIGLSGWIRGMRIQNFSMLLQNDEKIQTQFGISKTRMARRFHLSKVLPRWGKITSNPCSRLSREKTLQILSRLSLYSTLGLWMKKETRLIFIEVNDHELKETLHSFQKDKSTGPDGWPIEFYIVFYEVLEYDLLHVVEESKRNGRMHAPFNSAFLYLIPKKDEPLSFDEFRPISLCNCIYKIVEKFIARHIKPILLASIKKEQFGF